MMNFGVLLSIYFSNFDRALKRSPCLEKNMWPKHDVEITVDRELDYDAITTAAPPLFRPWI